MNAPVKLNPVAEVGTMLAEREHEFQAALPKHMPVERFMRVVMTAIQTTPALAKVERRSLFTSAMKAAQDGLLPDGREAALVIYRDKNRGEIAQYMPMIAGIRKKVRNSGEIETWDAHVVYENDQFDYELGDAPFIRHKPALGDRGKVIAAYSVATLKSGEKSREVMSIDEIEGIRKRSRAAGSGPWVTDYAEMCRKTVARRHAKVLPMSTDLDDVIRRDDELYDMAGASDKQVAEEKPRSLAARMDALAAPQRKLPPHDEETGEIIDSAAGDRGTETDAAPSASASPEANHTAISSKAAEQDDASGDNHPDDFPGDRPVPESAEQQDEQSEELKALLATAQKKVARGKKGLNLWVGGLEENEKALIKPHYGELLRQAALNDVPETSSSAPAAGAAKDGEAEPDLEPGQEASVKRAEEEGAKAATVGMAPRHNPYLRREGFERESSAWAASYTAAKGGAS